MEWKSVTRLIFLFYFVFLCFSISSPQNQQCYSSPCCNFEDFEEKMALTISVFPLYFFRISEKSLWCPSNQRRRGWRKSNKQPRRQRHQHQERTENRQQSSLVCPLLFCISFCISLCISFCICKYKRKGPSVWRWLQPSSDVGRQEQRALTQEMRGARFQWKSSNHPPHFQDQLRLKA